MRNCPKCNFSVVDDASTCPKCGIIFSKYEERLTSKTLTTTSSQPFIPAASTENTNQNQERKTEGSRAKFIVGAAVALLVFVFMAYLLPSRKESSLSFSEAIKTVKPALTAVRVFQEKSGTRFIEINGFFYGNKDQVVMCASLLRDASFIEVKAFDGRVYSATFIVSDDRPSGLVKLQLDTAAKEVSIVSASEVMPGLGERVFLLDSKSTSSDSIIQTDVSQIDDVPGLGSVFRLGMPVSEQMAGSPVFNSNARMIGVTTTIYEKGGFANFVVPSKYLVKLDQAKGNIRIAEWLASNLKQAKAQSARDTIPEGGVESEEHPEARDSKPEEIPSASSAQAPAVKDTERSPAEKAIPSGVIERVCKATVTVKTPLSIGSGFFVTDTGYILTNKHVVEKAETIARDYVDSLEKGRSHLEKGRDLLARMTTKLIQYEESLNRQYWEIHHLRIWIDDTQRRIASTGSFPALQESYDSKIAEHNQKVAVYNRMSEEHKQLLMDYERIKAQVESFQGKIQERVQEQPKFLYEPAYKIVLSDGSEHRVYKVTESTKYDLALLKLDGLKTPCVEVGDPKRVERGSRVFAIGSPLGLSHSVTSGVFSAHRGDMLQSSAPINPGNSGGPLLTEDGKVIGINTKKLASTHIEGKDSAIVVEGISFAIPIDVALKEFGVYIKTK
jgi:serine protease Do